MALPAPAIRARLPCGTTTSPPTQTTRTQLPIRMPGILTAESRIYANDVKKITPDIHNPKESCDMEITIESSAYPKGRQDSLPNRTPTHSCTPFSAPFVTAHRTNQDAHTSLESLGDQVRSFIHAHRLFFGLNMTARLRISCPFAWPPRDRVSTVGRCRSSQRSPRLSPVKPTAHDGGELDALKVRWQLRRGEYQ